MLKGTLLKEFDTESPWRLPPSGLNNEVERLAPTLKSGLCEPQPGPTPCQRRASDGVTLYPDRCPIREGRKDEMGRVTSLGELVRLHSTIRLPRSLEHHNKPFPRTVWGR